MGLEFLAVGIVAQSHLSYLNWTVHIRIFKNNLIYKVVR